MSDCGSKYRDILGPQKVQRGQNGTYVQTSRGIYANYPQRMCIRPGGGMPALYRLDGYV